MGSPIACGNGVLIPSNLQKKEGLHMHIDAELLFTDLSILAVGVGILFGWAYWYTNYKW